MARMPSSGRIPGTLRGDPAKRLAARVRPAPPALGARAVRAQVRCARPPSAPGCRRPRSTPWRTPTASAQLDGLKAAILATGCVALVSFLATPHLPTGRGDRRAECGASHRCPEPESGPRPAGPRAAGSTAPSRFLTDPAVACGGLDLVQAELIEGEERVRENGPPLPHFGPAVPLAGRAGGSFPVSGCWKVRPRRASRQRNVARLLRMDRSWTFRTYAASFRGDQQVKRWPSSTGPVVAVWMTKCAC